MAEKSMSEFNNSPTERAGCIAASHSWSMNLSGVIQVFCVLCICLYIDVRPGIQLVSENSWKKKKMGNAKINEFDWKLLVAALRVL